MPMQITTNSIVEQRAIERSGRKLIYGPLEKIPSIVVDNFPDLGKLTAFRFLEWVQQNPDGVIALPTGKTPEHFIRWVTFFLRNWDREDVRKELEAGGIDPRTSPNMSNLRFVQIDEFYPINPQQNNSFYHYINKFYIKGFGLNPQKALMIDAWRLGVPEGMEPNEVFPDGIVDLGLRTRHGTVKQERIQKGVIEAVDQFCTEYEQKIRAMGGIGFFLGGIGPDGHIGFNVLGSDHFSTTRLTRTNYETQAAAATDLGGIEVAKNRLVITIGLNTITFNKNAVAIVIAAGDAKARVVMKAIQEKKANQYPATVLQDLPNARFFLTQGASSLLVERRYEDVAKAEKLSEEQVERIVIDLALEKNKRLRDLTKTDFMSIRSSAEVLKKSGQPVNTITSKVEKSLKAKIEAGLKPMENATFMHTGPHHDDIMLGYLAYIIHLVRTPKNRHFFNYMTSGFTAVTNTYVLNQLKNLGGYIETLAFRQLHEEGYFDPNFHLGQVRDIYQYLDGVAAHSRSMKDEGNARRLLRTLIALFEEDSLSHLKNRILELCSYFETQYPGKKDMPYIQQLKGMIREWEADLLWGYFGFDSSAVNHLRLGFYKGDIFTEEPKVDRDVAPVLQLLERIKPTVVTVALDPEGAGPDTHYKVLQTISEALKRYDKTAVDASPQVWGYRNVWYRFHPSEVNIFVPVSLNSLAVLENAFMNCFGSQREASFPSYEFDGPFCRLAQKIMVEQYQQIKTCLGREYFNQNPHPRLRATHGLAFLKQMSLDEFYTRSKELRDATEKSISKLSLSELSIG